MVTVPEYARVMADGVDRYLFVSVSEYHSIFYVIPITYLTVVSCGPLPESHNSTSLLVSYSNGTTYNSIATYSCVFTHQLVGNNTERVCGSDGQWTGMEPYCKGI